MSLEARAWAASPPSAGGRRACSPTGTRGITPTARRRGAASRNEDALGQERPPGLVLQLRRAQLPDCPDALARRARRERVDRRGGGARSSLGPARGRTRQRCLERQVRDGGGFVAAARRRAVP